MMRAATRWHTLLGWYQSAPYAWAAIGYGSWMRYPKQMRIVLGPIFPFLQVFFAYYPYNLPPEILSVGKRVVGLVTEAYLRVSTDHQEVDNQRDGVLAYANAWGLGPLQFVEDAISSRFAWRERAMGCLLTETS